MANIIDDTYFIGDINLPQSGSSDGQAYLLRFINIYEKEYLAILIAVEQWRSYLQLAEFIIYLDQRSLTHLNDQRLNTVWQQKVFTKLLGL